MSSISKKEAQKKLKEEKKRIKEEQKRLKKEEASRKKKGAPAKPVVGQVIGAPTNFSHDTHVGWDTEHGFELRNIPMEWKKLFKDAGVTRAELEDPETRKLIVNTVRQSMYGGPAAPPPPPAPAPPPPPPAPGAPPPPSIGGGPAPPSFGLASPKPKRDPFAIGASVKAVWSGDGQPYNAKIESVREEDGYKYFTVTFVEYGNQEEVSQDGITPLEGADLSSKEQQGLEHLLKLQANSLKPPDISTMSESQEETIVDHLQKALAARRNGFVSVYGVEAVGAGAEAGEWEEDDSWMDF